MKKIVLLLIFVDIIFTFGAGLYGPIYAIFINQIGGDILEAGIAWSIFMIVMGTLEIPFGKLVDRYNKKLFLFISYALATLVIFAYIFISSVLELFILQIVVGIAFAIGDPAWEAWFSGAISRKERGFSFATFHALSSYSQAAAALIGGILAQFIGFKFLFIVGGIIGLMSVFLTLTLKETDNKSKTIWHRHRLTRKRYHHRK
jgi:MFS family permease